MAASAIACYIAFKALSLRKALVDHPYRSRALWTAVGALTLVGFSIAGYTDDVFGQVASTYTAVVAEATAWGFVFLGLYGWVASNANVAVDADFFNRDVLFWKKGGNKAALAMIVGAFVLDNLPPFWFSQANQVYYDAVATAGDVLLIIVMAYAIVVISITFFRIVDRRIKSYTLWVALSIASILAFGFSPALPGGVFLVAWMYCMYRAVGALAIRTNNLNLS